VFVAGFQTISGIASDFAARLDYVRPSARFLDGRNGTFSELLADGGRSPCLTLFEIRRYTKTSLKLAEAAREARIPLIFICDNHCYWARDYTDLVLPVGTQSHLFWDNQAPFLSLSNLLLDAVIARLGDAIEPRFPSVASKRRHRFASTVGASRISARTGKPTFSSPSASTRRETGCGRSTSGASAASGFSLAILAPAISNKTLLRAPSWGGFRCAAVRNKFARSSSPTTGPWSIARLARGGPMRSARSGSSVARAPISRLSRRCARKPIRTSARRSVSSRRPR
jgi:hypothetical protein